MTEKTAKNLTVGMVSLGCPKNVVDSERMLAEIATSGLFIASDPADADVVIINTCGFIAPARQEALEVIREAVEWKKQGRVRKVIVAGCLTERLKTAIFDEVEGIDAIVGLADRDNIGRIIRRAAESEARQSYLSLAGENCTDDSARLLITAGHWAYLRVSEGCNHRCSFCTIPSIRGPFRSKSQQQVLSEAGELASVGVVELNVIAQDVTQYGRDLEPKNSLNSLVKGLDRIDGVEWVRLMYLWPVGINDELIETIAGSDKVVNYLDIPIQHANDEILRAMKRPDTQARLREMIEKLRAAMGDIVLRTTLITGFPGETERQFADLLDFVKWARFDALGCFKFYPEDGTPAAELPDQVPDDVKAERLEQIMLAQQEIAFEKNSEKIGRELTVLVDSAGEDGLAVGRYYGQAPEIDSVCRIGNCTAQPGDFIRVQVTDTADYDLATSQIE